MFCHKLGKIMNRSALILFTSLLFHTASLYASASLDLETPEAKRASTSDVLSLTQEIESLHLDLIPTTSTAITEINREELNQRYIKSAGEHLAIKHTLVRLIELQRFKNDPDFPRQEQTLRDRLKLMFLESIWDEGLKVHASWEMEYPFDEEHKELYLSSIFKLLNRQEEEKKRALRLVMHSSPIPEDDALFALHVEKLCHSAQMAFNVHCDEAHARQEIEKQRRIKKEAEQREAALRSIPSSKSFDAPSSKESSVIDSGSDTESSPIQSGSDEESSVIDNGSDAESSFLGKDDDDISRYFYSGYSPQQQETFKDWSIFKVDQSESDSGSSSPSHKKESSTTALDPEPSDLMAEYDRINRRESTPSKYRYE
jgi:hypothetical protein